MLPRETSFPPLRVERTDDDEEALDSGHDEFEEDDEFDEDEELDEDEDEYEEYEEEFDDDDDSRKVRRHGEWE
jgi:hypothetical protein